MLERELQLFFQTQKKKIKEDELTPYECEGNPPKGRWDLLQSPPVGGGGRNSTRVSQSRARERPDPLRPRTAVRMLQPQMKENR